MSQKVAAIIPIFTRRGSCFVRIQKREALFFHSNPDHQQTSFVSREARMMSSWCYLSNQGRYPRNHGVSSPHLLSYQLKSEESARIGFRRCSLSPHSCRQAIYWCHKPAILIGPTFFDKFKRAPMKDRLKFVRAKSRGRFFTGISRTRAMERGMIKRRINKY